MLKVMKKIWIKWLLLVFLFGSTSESLLYITELKVENKEVIDKETVMTNKTEKAINVQTTDESDAQEEGINESTKGFEVYGKDMTYSSIGKKAVLMVDVVSSADISYTWYKGQITTDDIGTNLEDKFIKLDNNTKSLVFDKISSSDFGMYTCIITDGTNTKIKVVELKKLTYNIVSDKTSKHYENMNPIKYTTVREVSSRKNKIETTLPNGNYRYIWVEPLYSKDEVLNIPFEEYINYDSLNRSIIGNPRGNKVRCYAIPIEEYNKYNHLVFYNETMKRYREKYQDDPRGAYDIVDDTVTFFREDEVKILHKAEYVEEIILKNSNYDYELIQNKYSLGDSVLLKAPQADNVIEYEWLVNGVQRSKSKNLELPCLDIQDFGDIECIVTYIDTETGNTAFKSRIYNMIYLSDFSAQAINNTTICKGQSGAKLKVKATSSLPIKYMWTHAGKASVSGVSTNTLTIKDKITSVEIAGIGGKGNLINNYYTCTITDGIRSVKYRMGIKPTKGLVIEKGPAIDDPVYEKKLGRPECVEGTVTSNSLNVKWDAVEDATHYRVYVFENNKWKALVAYHKGTEYMIKNLNPGTLYIIGVKAFKIDGNVTTVAETFRIGNIRTAPGVPTYKRTGRGYTSLKLYWNKAKGATGYRIYIRENNKWKIISNTLTTNEYLVTGLKSGKENVFAIRAYRKEGNKYIWADTYRKVTAKTVKR